MDGARIGVLMVVGAYHPEIAGGGLQCRTLILALRDRVDFTVLTTTADTDAPFCSIVDGVRVFRVFVDPRRAWTKARALLQFARALPRIARACDIVHFHGFTQKMLLLLPLAKLMRRPIVEKMTSVGWDDPVSIRARPFGRVMARAFAAADRFVSISPAMTERMTRAGVPDSAVAVIPNGVDTTRFSPVAETERLSIRTTLGLSPSRWIVTFVGFWSKEKTPDLLFEAWLHVVRATGVDSELLFVGATEEAHLETSAHLLSHVLARAHEEHVTDRLRFVERTDDVPAYLRASDVFVLPSTREGLPNALLEAMATGLPCVCTELRGVTDWVTQSGLDGVLVPPDDVDALARALAAIQADPSAARALGARARTRVCQSFAITSVAKQYFALYQSIV